MQRPEICGCDEALQLREDVKWLLEFVLEGMPPMDSDEVEKVNEIAERMKRYG